MGKGSVRWLGHAFVEMVTADNRVVLFDPWTKEDGNPGSHLTLADISRADLVLISHDHFDHVASAVAICRKTGAFLGGPVQTVKRLVAEGFEEEKVVNFGFGYMVGGGVKFDWVEVIATPAMHSSDTACAVGTIVRASDGTTIYHAGDTSLFGDMELWGKLYPLDLAILPIGGVFTMDAVQASEAVRLLRPRMAMPIHYKSFPIVAQSAQEFLELCAQKAPQVNVVAPDVGGVLSLG
ncbi:MAG: metal-dependent hydrolase [Thermodesulfobacteriota bacterium]